MNPSFQFPAPGALYVSRFTAWAPGLDGPGDWREWALGNREITESQDGPTLDFAASLFRRRLSQISRMTIQVIRGLLPLREGTKIVFFSFRGEIARQFRINKTLIKEETIMPAAFSLSVFNAPPALAAMALNLTAGYTALYPGSPEFYPGLLAAAAPVLCGAAEETVLAYADEFVPQEYGMLCPQENRALAFGLVLSQRESPSSIPLLLREGPVPGEFLTPRNFLKYLYAYEKS
jgi:hypothetical protein